MPIIDFQNVSNVDEFTPLPDGSYPVEISEVAEKKTKHGDDMWHLTLTVLDGEFKNRKLFDNITFNLKGLKRVKLICSRIGIDVSGKVDLTTDMLIGKQAIVDVIETHYSDDSGKERGRNEIKFAGYECIGKPYESLSKNKNDITDSEINIPF